MHFHNSEQKFLLDTPAGVQPKTSDQTSIHISHLQSIGNFQPYQLLHHPAKVHSKISKKSPVGRPEIKPIHRMSKIPSCVPSSTILPFHTKRTSFQTPNLPLILLSNPYYLHSPHPDSVSYMGYTRPPPRPHGSHYTRIPGWIPLPGPVLNVSPGYSHEFSCAQGL